MASAADKFKKGTRKFVTSIGTGGASAGTTSIPLTDTTNLPADTGVILVIDAYDAVTGAKTPALTEVVAGVVNPGVGLTGCIRGLENTTAQSHVEGAVVTMYFTASHWDDLIAGIIAEHDQDGTHSTTLLAKLYPVGSLYMNATNSTNPATLLGFGTWTAFAAGRVLVGKNTSGTFNTAGATGGEETHTLTTSEMPSHNHGVNDPGHSHSFSTVNIGWGAGGLDQSRGRADANSPAHLWGNIGLNPSATGVTIQNAGSGTAHNNLQPYIVVYIWQRTA